MTLRLEDLTPDAQVTGLIGREAARIVSAQMMGEACDLVFRDGQGNLQSQILFRDKEADLDLVAGGRKWSFQGDGDKFRLVSEGERIRLAYLFDPYVAVSSSAIDPLPHQISAVYEHMLPRQPMRYLLADDPGAGKTIMAGLLIKELLIRGELERCLIVAPGSLSEQWQDELKEKFELQFELQFELLTRDLINATGLGNPFAPSTNGPPSSAWALTLRALLNSGKQAPIRLSKLAKYSCRKRAASMVAFWLSTSSGGIQPPSTEV